MYKDKAYRIIESDVKNGKTTHAYLIVCQDVNLPVYLKEYAKILLCDNGLACNSCRTCKLIDKEILPDCKCVFKDKILVEDIDEIIADSNLKPVEKDKKVYLISDFSLVNEKAQNKLLKTFETPPQNVYFLLAGSNEYKILPTIKSRAKKIEISPLDETEIVKILAPVCPDVEKLTTSASLSGGYLEKTKILYNQVEREKEIVKQILSSMKKSPQIPYYSKFITKDNVGKIVNLFKIVFSDLAKFHSGQNSFYFFSENDLDLVRALSNEYSTGACIELIEKCSSYEKALFFNANFSMLADDLLYSLLEVKYKWQKL